MKRLIVSIFALVLVVAITITNYFTVKNSTEKITNSVDIVVAEIDNKKDIEFYKEKIEKIWKEERYKLSFLVEHERFEILDESMLRLKHATDLESFKKECEHIKWFVNEIKSNEDLSLENVF